MNESSKGCRRATPDFHHPSEGTVACVVIQKFLKDGQVFAVLRMHGADIIISQSQAETVARAMRELAEGNVGAHVVGLGCVCGKV